MLMPFWLMNCIFWAVWLNIGLVVYVETALQFRTYLVRLYFKYILDSSAQMFSVHFQSGDNKHPPELKETCISEYSIDYIAALSPTQTQSPSKNRRYLFSTFQQPLDRFSSSIKANRTNGGVFVFCSKTQKCSPRKSKAEIDYCVWPCMG